MKNSITGLNKNEINNVSGSGLVTAMLYVTAPIIGTAIAFSILWCHQNPKSQKLPLFNSA